MSFILQALKKSEKERAQEQAGSPLLGPQLPLGSRQRIPPSTWAVLLVATIVTTALVVSLRTGSQKPLAELGPDTAVNEGPTTTHHEVPVPPPRVAEVKTEDIPRLSATARKIVFQGYSNAASTTAETAAPSRSELPAIIQSHLPSWKISGHTYAQDPKLRMVVIGSRILREGEQIDQQTTLLAITWEGIVVRHGNTVFSEVLHPKPTPQ